MSQQTLIFPEKASIDERFAEFDRAYPEVYELFKRFALDRLSRGWKRYSSDAICHRVRWETAVVCGEGGRKINDHFTACYARKLAAEDERFADFFEFRVRKSAG